MNLKVLHLLIEKGFSTLVKAFEHFPKGSLSQLSLSEDNQVEMTSMKYLPDKKIG